MKAMILLSMVFASSMAISETFNIDPAASRVAWKASKKTGSSHNGDIKVKSGKIETDAKGVIKTADIVIDMKTIANEDLKDKPDKQAQLVGHLSNDDFFKVDKFPESTFKLKSIAPKANAKDEYLVRGDLTMIGKTESIEFPAKITNDKKTITGKATVEVDRTKWGLQYGSGSIFKKLTADKIINDKFELTLDIVAKK